MNKEDYVDLALTCANVCTALDRGWAETTKRLTHRCASDKSIDGVVDCFVASSKCSLTIIFRWMTGHHGGPTKHRQEGGEAFLPTVPREE